MREYRELKDYLYEDDEVLRKIQHNPSVTFYYVATGALPVDEHFQGVRQMIEDELRKNTDCYFEDVRVELVGGKQILANCRELENNFTGADEPWLYFVTDCRKSRPHKYDLVQGPVANDKVFTTVNLFESGVLSAEAAILQLKAYKTYDQLSFHTQGVISQLKFVESIEV